MKKTKAVNTGKYLKTGTKGRADGEQHDKENTKNRRYGS